MDFKETQACLFACMLSVIITSGAAGLPDLQHGCPIPYFGDDCKFARPSRECESDLDCNKNSKCCVSWCHGTKCVEQKYKPGACPYISPLIRCLSIRADDIRCGVDSECGGDKLCCGTICGGTDCTDPAGPPDVKFGCPFPPRKPVFCRAFALKPECKTDSDCTSPKVCCTSPCNEVRCLAPKVKPGRCPRLMKVLCKKADFLRCGVDTDCEGNKKCCHTNCGGSDCSIQKGACVDAKGKTYYEGETWDKPPCDECNCRDGKINCYKKPCPPKPYCKKYIIKPGSCCHVCDDTCTQNGVKYKNGEQWVSADSICKICVCESGKIQCFFRDCAPPPFRGCVMDDKICCKWNCPSGCIVGDVIYKEGDQWNPTPCEHCRCEEGQPLCAIQDCAPPPFPSCVMDDRICCKWNCPPGCQVGDVLYKEGDTWNPSPCEHCRCVEGRPLCRIQDCAPPPCQNYKVKPGTCCVWICEPDLPPGLPKLRRGCPIPSFGPKCDLVRVGRFCKSDSDCKSKEKCCVTDCGGTKCIEAEMKPGVCERVDNSIQCVRQDDIRCGVDNECAGRNLCCGTPCAGSKCTDPAGPPKVRIGCPLPPRPVDEVICKAIPPVFECKSDLDCYKPQICCHDECGNVLCKDPAAQKPGRCPPVRLSLCKRNDIIRCGIDKECDGKDKCCATQCSGSLCQKPIAGPCNDNKKWTATIKVGKKWCKNCSCKKLSKGKNKALLKHACEHDIADAKKHCCKSCNKA